MEEALRKAQILVEALPYFKAFDEKIIVIKLGGNAMGDGELMRAVWLDIVFMEQVGLRPVLVHGGGPHISARLKESNIEVRFVDGLRVTDGKTLEVVEEVFGEINRAICKGILAEGGSPEPMSGARDRLILARKKPFPEGHDLGFVGEVVDVRPDKVLEATQRGHVPVISPLGIGSDGQLFNVNADTAAARIAAALWAEKLVFMSNIAGILRQVDDPDSLIATLKPRQIRELIAAGVIAGGMLPKVEAALAAMSSGVHKVHIIDGRKQHSMLLEIFTREGIGTQFIPQENDNT